MWKFNNDVLSREIKVTNQKMPFAFWQFQKHLSYYLVNFRPLGKCLGSNEEFPHCEVILQGEQNEVHWIYINLRARSAWANFALLYITQSLNLRKIFLHVVNVIFSESGHVFTKKKHQQFTFPNCKWFHIKIHKIQTQNWFDEKIESSTRGTRVQNFSF